jgi:hypothetical protein
VTWAAPLPNRRRTGQHTLFSPPVAEDGRRVQRRFEAAEEASSRLAAITPAMVTEPRYGCGAGPCGLRLRWQCSRTTRPETAGARSKRAENSQTSAPRESLSLDHRGPHQGSAGRHTQGRALTPGHASNHQSGGLKDFQAFLCVYQPAM